MVYREGKASMIRLVILNPLLQNVLGYGIFLTLKRLMIATGCSANNVNKCTSSSLPYRRVLLKVIQSQTVKSEVCPSGLRVSPVSVA